MAKMNIGGRVVDVPNSLDPSSPQDLRGSTPRPNSFGDAASNAQVKTPAPQLRLPAPEVAKPLFGPHDPIYHGDGRYGAPPNPGATNATAGATQSTKWFNPPGGPGDGAGAPNTQPAGGAGGRVGDVPAAEAVKRPGLRGALDTAKSYGGGAFDTAKSYGGKAYRAVTSTNGGGALAALGAAVAEKEGLDAVERDPNATALDKGAAFGGAAARTFGTGAGAIAGGAKGALLGTALWPGVGTAIGGIGGALAGGYLGNKVADTAIEVGQDLTGSPGYGTAAAAQKAVEATPTAPAAAPTLRTPTQNPLRVQEARNNIADPGRAPVAFPEGYQQLQEDLRNPMSNASLQKSNPAGQVQKVVGPDGKVTYSGDRVSGDVSFTDANGKALPGQGGGGFIRGSGDGTFRGGDGRPPSGFGVGGQSYSTRENAIMAANLRDGVDLRRGLGGGGQAMSRGQQYMQQALNAPRTLKNLTQVQLSRIQDNATRMDEVDQRAAAADALNKATLRGQDMELEGRIAPKRMELEMQRAQRERVASYLKGGEGEDQKGGPDYVAAMQRATANGDTTAMEAFSKLITAAQEAKSGSNKIDKSFRERLADAVVIPELDADGKPTDKRSASAEADAVSRIISTRPDLAQLSVPDLNALLPSLIAEITATNKLNAAGRDVGLGWRGSVVPSYNKPVPGTSTPRGPEFFKGKRLEDKGFFNWVGSSGGNTTLRGSDGWLGTEHDLGTLTAEERAYVQAQIDAANKQVK